MEANENKKTNENAKHVVYITNKLLEIEAERKKQQSITNTWLFVIVLELLFIFLFLTFQAETIQSLQEILKRLTLLI